MGRVLAIDTSGNACSLALLDHGHILAERHEDIGRGHAEAIMPWIASLPEGGKAHSLIVGCGPGSFTGVRVGIAAGRALALAWDIPVHGFSSLALIAASTAAKGTLLVAIEGGHGELFLQMFECGQELAVASALFSLAPDVAASRLHPQFLAGNGATRFIEAGGHGEVLPSSTRAALAMDLPQPMRALPPSPIYGRGADAKPMAQ